MTEPILPEEVTLEIPDEIFEEFNRLIKNRWDGKESVVYQDEIIAIVEDKLEGFKMEWLDIEPYYKRVGWRVVYDTPDVDENFRSYFSFRKGNT